MTCSIYKLTNRITGKSYIGVSRNSALRFQEHRYSPDLIGKTIRKYGKENFLLKTLLLGDKDYCFNLEPLCIEVFGTRVPNGYNISPGGDRGPDLTGRIHRLETKQKISRAHKGKKKGLFSQEWRDKIGAALKGKKRPPEIIKKWMETKRKNPKIRPTISEETREKLRQAIRKRTPWNKGKKGCFSPEIIQKLKKIHSTRKREPHSEETKQRIGAKSKGRYFSPEVRKKMSESRKAYLAEKRKEK